MGLLGGIALGAVAVLVAAWLAVSFLAPGRARGILAWAGALAFYAALLCLFLNLTRRAWHDDSTLGLVAFGFLALLFTSGLCVTAFRLLGELRGRRDVHTSTTN